MMYISLWLFNTVQPSVCPLDCPDRCTLEVTVENDRVVKLDGSHRSDYTDGYICAKVRGFTARQYSPERVLRPMKRVGPKGGALRNDFVGRGAAAYRRTIHRHRKHFRP